MFLHTYTYMYILRIWTMKYNRKKSLKIRTFFHKSKLNCYSRNVGSLLLPKNAHKCNAKLLVDREK